MTGFHRWVLTLMAAGLLAGLPAGCDRAGGEADPQRQAETTAVVREPAGERVFAVEGMHCERCVSNVEAALLRLEGVEDAQVSLAEGRASIRVAEGGPQDLRLLEAIRELGFYAMSSPDR